MGDSTIARSVARGVIQRVLAAGIFALTCGTLGPFALAAEVGITDREIIVGRSIALTGPVSALAQEYEAGARAYFDQLNAKGGVHGRKIKLISLDDGYDVHRAIENTRQLIHREQVFVAFGQFGTGVLRATIPVLRDASVPLFASASGADSLRDSSNGLVFTNRATYGQEVDRMVQQLVTIGSNSIAVAYQDDEFGRSGLQAAQRALTERKLTLAAGAGIKMPEANAVEAAVAIAKSRPQAILLAAAGMASVSFISEYRKIDRSAQFFALSVVSSRQLVSELGQLAQGVVVSQVMPSPWRSTYTLAEEYRRAMVQRSQVASYSSFEAYVSAKIFVEALRRAGPSPTRKGFISAVEGMTDHDAGGFLVHFGPKRHDGSTYVDLSMITRGGEFLR